MLSTLAISKGEVAKPNVSQRFVSRTVFLLDQRSWFAGFDNNNGCQIADDISSAALDNQAALTKTVLRI
jgi:hypothetical protein